MKEFGPSVLLASLVGVLGVLDVGGVVPTIGLGEVIGFPSA
jgi:hypothetical protein